MLLLVKICPEVFLCRFITGVMAFPPVLGSLSSQLACYFQLSSGTRLWLGQQKLHLQQCTRFSGKFPKQPSKLWSPSPLGLGQLEHTQLYSLEPKHMIRVGRCMTGSLQPGMRRRFADVWVVMQIIPHYFTDSESFLNVVRGYVAFYWT